MPDSMESLAVAADYTSAEVAAELIKYGAHVKSRRVMLNETNFTLFISVLSIQLDSWNVLEKSYVQIGKISLTVYGR